MSELDPTKLLLLSSSQEDVSFSNLFYLDQNLRHLRKGSTYNPYNISKKRVRLIKDLC